MPIGSFAGVSGTPRSAAELHGLIEKIDLLVLNLLSEEGYDAGATYRIGDRLGTSESSYLPRVRPIGCSAVGPRGVAAVDWLRQRQRCDFGASTGVRRAGP